MAVITHKNPILHVRIAVTKAKKIIVSMRSHLHYAKSQFPKKNNTRNNTQKKNTKTSKTHTHAHKTTFETKEKR